MQRFKPQPSGCLALSQGSWFLQVPSPVVSLYQGKRRVLRRRKGHDYSTLTKTHSKHVCSNSMLRSVELKGLMSDPGGPLPWFPLDRQHTVQAIQKEDALPLSCLFLGTKLSSKVKQQSSLPKQRLHAQTSTSASSAHNTQAGDPYISWSRSRSHLEEKNKCWT